MDTQEQLDEAVDSPASAYEALGYIDTDDADGEQLAYLNRQRALQGLPPIEPAKT